MTENTTTIDEFIPRSRPPPHNSYDLRHSRAVFGSCNIFRWSFSKDKSGGGHQPFSSRPFHAVQSQTIIILYKTVFCVVSCEFLKSRGCSATIIHVKKSKMNTVDVWIKMYSHIDVILTTSTLFIYSYNLANSQLTYYIQHVGFKVLVRTVTVTNGPCHAIIIILLYNIQQNMFKYLLTNVYPIVII